ncbi:uncharacterized protein LOC115301365 isoform X4 [Suricata suricatta]|uniref:uncharacterized protein LOC115301365 isoform X4 n=1 Tax=Suricata suricatta TaxID=37032 RepID=UPI001155C719|nr:uncharacterized protein LOC115301365 isoform X4 [Suricata suricatta]XP_029807045.1 uncharacterized protein LOC115301365 isoform X4 [Suricata suricatta]
MPPREPTSSNCERWSQVPGRLRREGVEGAHARAAGRQAAPAETWTWGYQAARKPTVRGSPGLRTGTPSRGNLTAALSQRSGRLSDANGHPGRSGRRPHITIGTPVTAHCPLGRGSFHITAGTSSAGTAVLLTPAAGSRPGISLAVLFRLWILTGAAEVTSGTDHAA